MKQETKAKIISKLNKVHDKAVIAGTAAAVAVNSMAVTASAVDPETSSAGSLSQALSGVDTSVVLSGFYEVLPIVLTIALPIIGAKVALNFLFGSVKGA